MLDYLLHSLKPGGRFVIADFTGWSELRKFGCELLLSELTQQLYRSFMRWSVVAGGGSFKMRNCAD